MAYHYQGGTDLVVSAKKTGVPDEGKYGYLWDAQVGGNQFGADAVFDDNGGDGFGDGRVIAGPGGRLSFTMDETLGAKECWLDLGSNERWRLRSWESYGPRGEQGPKGPRGSGLPFPLPAGTAAPGAIPVLNENADGTIWADPSTLTTGGGGGYEGAAPGAILRWPTPDKADQVLPRPTSRLDVVVRWYLPTAPPEGNGYSIPGVDEWVDTSA